MDDDEDVDPEPANGHTRGQESKWREGREAENEEVPDLRDQHQESLARERDATDRFDDVFRATEGYWHIFSLLANPFLLLLFFLTRTRAAGSRSLSIIGTGNAKVIQCSGLFLK